MSEQKPPSRNYTNVGAPTKTFDRSNATPKRRKKPSSSSASSLPTASTHPLASHMYSTSASSSSSSSLLSAAAGSSSSSSSSAASHVVPLTSHLAPPMSPSRASQPVNFAFVSPSRFRQPHPSQLPPLSPASSAAPLPTSFEYVPVETVLANRKRAAPDAVSVISLDDLHAFAENMKHIRRGEPTKPIMQAYSLTALKQSATMRSESPSVVHLLACDEGDLLGEESLDDSSSGLGRAASSSSVGGMGSGAMGSGAGAPSKTVSFETQYLTSLKETVSFVEYLKAKAQRRRMS